VAGEEGDGARGSGFLALGWGLVVPGLPEKVLLFCVQKQISTLPGPVFRGRTPSKKRITLIAVLPLRVRGLAFAFMLCLLAALSNSNRLGQGQILLNST